MTGSVPVDWQLTDTYFVVAHLHYVLIGINVFPVVGAIYFWFPKMTGRMMDERLGRWNFWTMFIGFNLGFFPMHISGLLGMPRRIYTYADGMGWDWLNLITTLGPLPVRRRRAAVRLINVVVSLTQRRARRRQSLGCADPGMGDALAAAALQFRRHPDGGEPPSAVGGPAAGDAADSSVIGAGLVLDHGRETLGTTPLDAEPDVILKMPGDTLVPLLLALALTALFSGLPGVLVVAGRRGGRLRLAVMIAWLWPERALGETGDGMPPREVPPDAEHPAHG